MLDRMRTKLMSENIKQVGVLQDFGVPFSSLYVDMKNRLLYICQNDFSEKQYY